MISYRNEFVWQDVTPLDHSSFGPAAGKHILKLLQYPAMHWALHDLGAWILHHFGVPGQAPGTFHHNHKLHIPLVTAPALYILEVASCQLFQVS